MKIIDRKFLNTKTKSCHAGTIAFFDNKPVFSWFGGTKEGALDSAIYIQRNDVVTSLAKSLPAWNPILFPFKNKLFLFAKFGLFCDRWQTFIYDITEENSISKEVILPAGLNGPVKTKPLIALDGDCVIMPSSVETMYDWTSYMERYHYSNGEFCFYDRSEPLTVKKKKYIDRYGTKRNSLGIIQPALWSDEENEIHAFFRSSHGLENIYYSKARSLSTSLTWDNPKPINISNPNSGIDVVWHKSRLFLVCNPIANKRNPLVILELDKNFNIVDKIVIQESLNDFPNEYSYPYMIEHNDELHLVYTCLRKKIVYIRIGI